MLKQQSPEPGQTEMRMMKPFFLKKKIELLIGGIK